MKFTKYHALGNDYIVMDPKDLDHELSINEIQTICHRNYGVGSDGILYGPLSSDKCDYKLRIFNPDGSEAEKSGNGLRIFSRYIYDISNGSNSSFSVETIGGNVQCDVTENGGMVVVEMGKVSFDADIIPVNGFDGEVVNKKIDIAGKELLFSAATVGNPHCVVLCDEVLPEEAHRLGPIIEKHHFFPNKTNVQFLKVIDRNNIQIEIWERGAGYTLASGSSSTAAAAVAKKLGLCDSEVTVNMPGGVIKIRFDEFYNAIMTGPVSKICVGNLCFD